MKITEEMLVAKVKELAATYPNARYKGVEDSELRCQYRAGIVENGPPGEGCIFGHALMALCPEIFADDDYVDMSIDHLCRFHLDFKPKSRLFAVQDAQDNGDTWGVAIKELERTDE